MISGATETLPPLVLSAADGVALRLARSTQDFPVDMARQLVPSALAALALPVAFDASRLPLVPIYGSVAASDSVPLLFRALCVLTCCTPVHSWSLYSACACAATVLAAYPLSFYPFFKLSSVLGTTFGPCLSQLALAVPLFIALQAPLRHSFGTFYLVATQLILFELFIRYGRHYIEHWISPPPVCLVSLAA